MRKTKYVSSLLMLLAFALMVMPMKTAFAEQEAYAQANAGAAGVNLLLFREDQTLTMPKNTVSYWFVIPDGVSLQGQCTLTLHMAHSPTLIDSLSSVTAYVNGKPVATRGIVDSDAQEFNWDIPFDASLVKAEGYNEIKITAVQRSIEGDCADIDNPSNWVVLYKDSHLKVWVTPSANPSVSGYFHLYYDTFSRQFAIENDYVLGNPADSGMVATMLELSNSGGMYYQDKEYVRYAVYGKDGVPENGRNKIFIETGEQPGGWTSELLNLPADPAGADNAYVSIKGVTDKHPFYKLLVSGGGGAGLNRAAAFLSNRTLVEQAEGNGILLRSDIKAENTRRGTSLKETGAYSFSDFGYEDISLAGTFHQRANLSFVQVNGISGEAGSYLDIRFRHSAALLSDRSAMTVSVNNVAVNSVKLSPANAQEGRLVVDIPASALKEPIINVTIECYHYLGKVDCTKDYYDIAWTVIDAEGSGIYFKESRNALRPTLSGFPYFYNTGDEAVVSVALSGSGDSGVLEAASMLAARTGQNTGAAFKWEVMSDGSYGETAGDLVILAEKSAAALPQEISGRLAIVPDGDGYAVQDDSLSVIPETLDNKAIIQVIRSPWDFYKKIYVLLYDGQKGLTNLSELLGEREKLNRLDGQVCIVGDAGSVRAFTVARPDGDGDKVPMTATDYVRRAEAFTGMSMWLMLLILAAVALLIIFVVRLVRRKHDEYERAGQEHKREQGFSEDDGDTGDDGKQDDEKGEE